MVKHTRTDSIKPLIDAGHIKEFSQIFLYVPKTSVANDLGIHFNRFNSFLERVAEMRISDMYLLCAYFEIEPHKMFELINNQHTNAKKIRNKK
jgi:hypothetical protein